LDFVESDASPLEHLQRLQADAHTYSGFNLLCGDTRRGCVAVLGNRGTAAAAGPQAVPPGVHALSNGVFGDEWPKVARGRAVLSDILARWAPGAHPPTEELLTRLLGDATCDAPDDALPRTCVTRAEERGLAPAFVDMDDLAGCGRYGTRSCVVLLVRRDGAAELTERLWEPTTDGQSGGAWRTQLIRFSMPVGGANTAADGD
jgi:uncharacterized protein with NRDE domain